MVEQEPKDYQFKHKQQIHLDQYAGIASDLMAVNDPVADGFMRVADIRRDIVILSKYDQRAVDYDQLGDIKVGKFTQFLPFRQAEKTSTITATDDAWFIKVNDQKLSRQITEDQDSKKNFDTEFTNEFKSEINKNIQNILIKEKLLNGENFNAGFYFPYLMTADILLSQTAEHINNYQNNLPLIIYSYAINLGINGFALNFALKIVSPALGNDMKNKVFPEFLRCPTPEEPIVRSSLIEMLAGPLPLDRLARGAYYLKKHGNDIIQTSD